MKAVNSCVFVLALVICAKSQPVSPGQRPSDRLLRFLSVFRGYYQGFGMHYVESRAKQDPREYNFQKIITPVLVPALFPNPTFLYQEIFFGKIEEQNLITVWEDAESNIYVRFFPLSGVRPSDTTSEYLQALHRDDLPMDPKCDLFFRELSDSVFFGTWPFCEWTEGGVTPYFALIWSCNGVRASFYDRPPWNETVFKTFNMKPYKSGAALLPYMMEGVDDYTDPCDTYYDKTGYVDQPGDNDQHGDGQSEGDQDNQQGQSPVGQNKDG